MLPAKRAASSVHSVQAASSACRCACSTARAGFAQQTSHAGDQQAADRLCHSPGVKLVSVSERGGGGLSAVGGVVVVVGGRAVAGEAVSAAACGVAGAASGFILLERLVRGRKRDEFGL